MSEADIHVAPSRLFGVVDIPSRARDGVYEFSIELTNSPQIVAPLVVLSEIVQRNLLNVEGAEQNRIHAYRHLSDGNTQQALSELLSAEGAYDDAGWEHDAVDTMLERAFILGPLKPAEARDISRHALGRLNRLGLACRRIGSWGRAGIYFRRAKSLAEELKDAKEIAINTNNIGEVLLYLRFTDEHLIDEAESNFRSVLEYAQKANDEAIAAIAHENLATIGGLRQQFPSAIQELRIARGLMKEPHDAVGIRRIDQKLQVLSAALETGQQVPVTIDPRARTLNEAIQQIVNRVRPLADRQDLDLRTDSPEDVPLAQFDASQLVRSLDVLLTNALAFASPGATLMVITRIEPQGDRMGVRIRVTGCDRHISSEDFRRVFENLPFFERPVHNQELSLWIPARQA